MAQTRPQGNTIVEPIISPFSSLSEASRTSNLDLNLFIDLAGNILAACSSRLQTAQACSIATGGLLKQDYVEDRYCFEH